METRHKGTRVVTFRLSDADYKKLEEVRRQVGASFADLVLVGAHLLSEQRRSKLAEVSELERRLARFKQAIQQAQQDAEQAVSAERERQLASMNDELKSFELFSAGWQPEEASFELGLSLETVYEHLRAWGDARNKKQIAETELLRALWREHYWHYNLVLLESQMSFRLKFRTQDIAPVELKGIVCTEAPPIQN
ncbi:MAG: hypothetical protein ACOC6S_02185 [Chloroflexota bacterium]